MLTFSIKEYDQFAQDDFFEMDFETQTIRHK